MSIPTETKHRRINMERYSSEETKLERIETDVNVRNSAVEASAALKQGLTEAKNGDCRIIPQRR